MAVRSGIPQAVNTAMLACFALVVFLSIPSIADKGIVFIAGMVALQIVFGLTWNLMFGQTGLVSFGHASFFAIGGYSYAYAARALPQLHPLVTFTGAGLLCALIATLVGLVALRRSVGVYFAILTLALSQIVYLVISSSAALGREDGFTGIRRPRLPLGWTTIDLAAGNNYYYFLVLCCALLCGVVWWVTHSRVGRVFRAIQQDPERSAFLGIPVQRYRLLSYAIASGIAGVAGALFGPWLQILTPGGGALDGLGEADPLHPAGRRSLLLGAGCRSAGLRRAGIRYTHIARYFRDRHRRDPSHGRSRGARRNSGSPEQAVATHVGEGGHAMTAPLLQA